MCIHFTGEFYSLESALKFASLNFHSPMSKVLYPFSRQENLASNQLSDMPETHGASQGVQPALGSCQDL